MWGGGRGFSRRDIYVGGTHESISHLLWLEPLCFGVREEDSKIETNLASFMDSIINTWVGSLVGAIPPLIGWSAATGSVSLAGQLLQVVYY